MNEEIKKHIDALRHAANNKTADEQTLTNIYEAAKNFCLGFNPTTDEKKKECIELLCVLDNFRDDLGLFETDSFVDHELDRYIERIQQILEQVREGDFNDVDELQDEIAQIRENVGNLYETASSVFDDVVPLSAQKRFDKFDELIAELSEYDFLFFDAEAELDAMFPNRHDEDYDEDEFDVNTFLMKTDSQ